MKAFNVSAVGKERGSLNMSNSGGTLASRDNRFSSVSVSFHSRTLVYDKQPTLQAAAKYTVQGRELIINIALAITVAC